MAGKAFPENLLIALRLPSMKPANRFFNSLRYAVPLVALVVCAGRLLWIVRTYSVNVFIGDQWVYNEPTLFHRQSAWTIFRWQSGPWRQGLGGLLSAAIGRLTNWNSRDESFVCAGLLIAGCVLAFYLSFRVKGALTAWDAVIPLLILSPVEYQTVVGVTHYSHGPLPFLLVIVFCVAFTVRRYQLKYALIVVTTFFCTYTGFGVFIGLLCPLAIALELWTRRSEIERSEKAAGLISLALSILSLVSFLVGFRSADGVCPAHVFADPATGLAARYPNPLHYFLFLAFMFADFVGLKATIALTPSILGGSAVLLLVLGGLLFAASKPKRHLIPLVLIAYSLLFAVITAYGRMCLGLGAALGSRYMVYLVPSFLGVYFLAMSSANRVVRYSLLLILGSVALFSSAAVHRADRDDMVEFRRQRSEWKQCYLAEHDLLDCNRKTGATVYSYPDTIQDRIDFIERNRLNFFHRSRD